MHRLLAATASILAAGLLTAAAGASTSPISRIHVGETQKRVGAILGENPVLCTIKVSSLCRTPVYLYEYVDRSSVGIGVRFRNVRGIERVSKVFALKPVSGP